MVANFSVAGAVNLLAEIHLLIHLSSHNKQREAHFGSDIAKDPKYGMAISETMEAVSVVLSGSDNLLTIMPSSHVSAAAKRLRAWTELDKKTFESLFERSCRLRDTITIELREYSFYAYSKENTQRVNSWKIDWAKVLSHFPDTEADIFGAIDCYSLKHHTASVFHAMRIAEHGLRGLARERKIRLPKNKPVEWATWQEVIRALDDEIKRIGYMRPSKGRDTALAYCSGARADLNGFKDEYRNAVMHVRASYDEHQALRALTKVHAFMDRLSDGLAARARTKTKQP